MIGKCLHLNGIENKQMVGLKTIKGLNFFAKKGSQEPYDLLYVELKEGYMLGLGNIYNLDSEAENIINQNINLHQEIENSVNQCLENEKSVFLGYAEYLGRLPEAVGNNKKVYERQQLQKQHKEEARKRQEEEQMQQREKELTEAEEIYKNGNKISAELFLSLCDKYKIKVAIKTRGWIINSLNDISYSTHSYCGNSSTKISGIACELKNILLSESEAV